MSGAPLSAGAWEILGALALGIRIRKLADGWQAVGPWQEPSSSGVDLAIMTELIEARFVESQTLGIGSYAAMTKLGETALREKTEREIRNAIKWVKDG